MTGRARPGSARRALATTLRLLFAAIFVGSGVLHLLTPEPYLRIVPPWLPWPGALVWSSGVAEIVLGALLLPRATRRPAAWGLVALLVAVFPANVQMALDADAFPEIPPALLWVRLPLQLPLIAWAWSYTRTGRSEASR